MNYLRPLTLLFIILGFAACKQADDPTILINIENEFRVSMEESLEPGDNQLLLKVYTVEELECLNYEIFYSHSVSEGTVVASIDELVEPENCDVGMAHASAYINLGQLDVGTYALQLNLNNNSIVNNGLLVVNEHKYSVVLDTEHGLDIKPKELNKIPDGYFWGQINTASDLSSSINDDFLIELIQFSQNSNLSDGNYAYFEIDDKVIEFEEDIPVSFTNPHTSSFLFKMDSDGDSDAIKDLIETYRDNYMDKIDITATTSEGELL